MNNYDKTLDKVRELAKRSEYQHGDGSYARYINRLERDFPEIAESYNDLHAELLQAQAVAGTLVDENRRYKKALDFIKSRMKSVVSGLGGNISKEEAEGFIANINQTLNTTDSSDE